MRHRRLAALLGVVALLAACTSSEAEPVPPIGGESPAPTPSPSPSPTPEDPYAIPDEIDEAYVDLVTNEIFLQISGLLADILRQPTGYSLDDDDARRLGELAEGSRLSQMVVDYQRYSDTPREDLNFIDPDEFGQLTWETELILEADTDCIVAIGYYDNREISTQNPSPDQYSIISLAATAESPSAESANRTPWRLRDLKQMVDPEGNPIPQENWATLDYSILDTTCG